MLSPISKVIRVILLATSVFFSGQASAQIVSFNGLDWLSLDETAGLSYWGAYFAWDEGGDFRYATNDEVVSMLASYSSLFTNTDVTVFDPHNHVNDAASKFKRGVGHYDSGYRFFGFYRDEDTAFRMAGIEFYGGLYMPITIYGDEYSYDFHHEILLDGIPNIGWFMVAKDVPITDPVPEPSTLVLMGLGLLGMFGVNRRKVQA